MFFGLLVFSALQVAVLQVVAHDTRFETFAMANDQNSLLWLSNLEKSNDKKQLPADLYEGIRRDLWRSFRYDPRLIFSEYDFYSKLSPKLQSELINFLFGDFIQVFDQIFSRCESQFINNMIVHLRYNQFEHG